MAEINACKNHTTIVVNTCDAYEDVWELFFSALKDRWPNCSFPIVVNTESKVGKTYGLPVTFHAFKDKNSSRDFWGARLRSTLEDIQSEIVIMLYDDYVLHDVVDDGAIIQAVKNLKENPDVSAFYLINNPENNNIDDKRFSAFERIPARGDYILNSAPAVWRRQDLIDLVGSDDTPWAWEFFGGYRTFRQEKKFYCVKAEHEYIYPYAYAMGGAIYRGRWVSEVVLPLIDRYRLKIDLTSRGIADGQDGTNGRSLKWKIDFFKLGFRMIGAGASIFFFRALRKKIQRKFL